MENKVIEIRNFTKDYGQGRGVFDISFDVFKSECFGFLGPNGAGKSTTIRHILAFSKPQSGEILLNGQSTWENRSKLLGDVGYLPGEIALPNQLTGKEFLNDISRLKGVKDFTFLNYLKKLFELDDSLLCKEMSLGMKRKLAIVACFMNDPDILILDEPSSGLDPYMQGVFINFIKKEKERGKTILLSSHIFNEINDTCDRIAVIKDGKIVSLIKADELRRAKNKRYLVSFKLIADYSSFLNEIKADFKIIHTDKNNYEVLLEAEDEMVNKLISILKKYEPKSLNIYKQSLEEYFMSFYKEEKTFGGVK